MSTAQLPALNALLNTIAAILLVLGVRAIRARQVDKHKKIMVSALVVSAAFLTSYLVYHSLHGSKHFGGPVLVRKIYLAILLPHTVLAAINLPFIIATVFRALKGEVDRHKKIAKITWFIWMFVSVTGVVVYLMNYIIWPGTPPFEAAQALHRAQKDGEALVLYRRAAGGGGRTPRQQWEDT